MQCVQYFHVLEQERKEKREKEEQKNVNVGKVIGRMSCFEADRPILAKVHLVYLLLLFCGSI